MCRFCVEHGEGERWYLQAENYSADLLSDAKRRDYIVSFIRDFPDTRRTALTWAKRLDSLPRPLGDAGKRVISRSMVDHHFGQPVPLEECDRILDMATSITVIPCICRMHASDKPAEEVCVLVTMSPVEPLLTEGFSDYADGPGLEDFHRVSASEAKDLLRTCEQSGLMHSIWTFKTPFAAAICNCNLESGCLAMRMTAGHGVKLMWRGEWVAKFDSERCTRCRRCQRVCPFDAITMEGRAAPDATSTCWGCGVCRSVCREDAITLTDRRDVPAAASLW